MQGLFAKFYPAIFEVPLRKSVYIRLGVKLVGYLFTPPPSNLRLEKPKRHFVAGVGRRRRTQPPGFYAHQLKINAKNGPVLLGDRKINAHFSCMSFSFHQRRQPP